MSENQLTIPSRAQSCANVRVPVLQQLASKPKSKPRHGPKPKSIAERKPRANDFNPIRRPERSWSQNQKIRVLVFLCHHRIPVTVRRENRYELEYRCPTQQEAAALFRVPQTTVSNWVKQQEAIEKIGRGSNIRSLHTVEVCRWPDLEQRLFTHFLEQRKQGHGIRLGWFRVNAIRIFAQLYSPTAVTESLFRFSNGWFSQFLQRHRISIRCITKTAQKVPEDYAALVINWLRFNRRNSQPLSQPLATREECFPGAPFLRSTQYLNKAVGRYDLCSICNLDETPIPFEYLNGRTYDFIGSKTIWVKESRSGWDKRQASLVLCIFADGFNRVPPMVIFHGLGKRLGNELDQYHPGVIVEFNDTAYMNDDLMVRYLEQWVIPALNGKPSLLAMDLCVSHKTEAVKNILRAKQIIPSMIPAGCTSLVQPLDVSVNKPLKALIGEMTNQAIVDSIEDEYDLTKPSAVGKRRVLTTWCVGDAWYQFCIEKKDLIQQAFRKLGLALPIDGSADIELDIKGFAGLEIGDWRHDLNIVEPHADVEKDHDDIPVEYIAGGED